MPPGQEGFQDEDAFSPYRGSSGGVKRSDLTGSPGDMNDQIEEELDL